LDCRVELRFAPLPLIGALAVHYWFVVLDEGGCHRWEVWQTKNAGGDRCIGHVHRDLKAPEEGVGGGGSRVEKQWVGEEARRIARILECVDTYPWCQRYRYWPGPNSNTFAAWVLRQAGVSHVLGPRAWGKRYFAAKQ
jgi:hypothetical protein